MRAGRPRRASHRLALAALLAGLSLGGCKDRNATGELASPKDAAEFENQYRKAFDDDYTRQAVELRGRAPHDVLDQQLFAERLGYSDVLAKVRVQQVFGKGRYQGRKEQFIAIAIEEELIGAFPEGTDEEQLLLIKGDDPLPGDLNDATLLLFLKWAPGETPSYHHHLMPADDDLLAKIAAMVKLAQEEGVLDSNGEVTSGRKRRKAERAREKREQETPAEADAPE
jgi:hypothetical protein